MKPKPINPNHLLVLRKKLTTAVISLLLCANTGAATFTVTNNLDDSSGGSLRQVIADANSGDTIGFEPSLSGGTITLTSGQILIDKSLTIDASSLAERPTINANGSTTNHRVMEIGSGSNVVLDSIIIINGQTSDPPPNNCGGGIFNNGGTLTIRNSTVSGNSADFGGGIMNDGGTVTLESTPLANNTATFGGGGIYNLGNTTFNGCLVSNNQAGLDGGGVLSAGPLTIINSTVSGNDATSNCGGGIYQVTGTLVIRNTTITDNTSPCGGGIFNASPDATLNSSTFFGNPADTQGGGIFNSNGTLTISNSTISGNSATNNGGGILNESGTLTITDTIIGGNTSTDGPDLDNILFPGTVNTTGNNLFSNLSDSGLSSGSTVQVGDPLLANLGDYGGPTQTMPPIPGSPAIDAGTTTDPGGTDQRGFPRFFGGALDLGAIETSPEIEIEQPADSALTDGSSTVDFGSLDLDQLATRTFFIRNTGTTTLTGIALSLSGNNIGDFTAGALEATSLTPGSSTSFQVVFTPSAVGTRSTEIRVMSNDSDENPFNITLTGVGTGSPEIEVEQPSGNTLAAGVSEVDFEDVKLGSSTSRTFTIRNSGTVSLTGLAATISGIHASDYTIEALGATSLGPDASTTFKVSFSPGAIGTRPALIRISSNDADENPFNLSLIGTGVKVTKPEIAITLGKTKNLRDGKSTSTFPSTKVGKISKVFTFRIKNTGTSKLKKLRILIRGQHAKDFKLVKKPSSVALAPGKVAIFKIAFKPKKSGNRKAELRVASNDNNENPFNLELKGKGKGK